MSEQQTDDQTNEVAEHVRWRRREALAAGLTRIEANLYAESEISAQELRRLVKQGCPKRLVARILL